MIENTPMKSHNDPQSAAVISLDEIIGLCVKAVAFPHFPQGWQDEERKGVGQGSVDQDIESGSAFGISPPTGPEKSEGGVDFAGHQKPDDDDPEPPPSHRPVFQIHLDAPSSIDTEQRRKDDGSQDDD